MAKYKILENILIKESFWGKIITEDELLNLPPISLALFAENMWMLKEIIEPTKSEAGNG